MAVRNYTVLKSASQAMIDFNALKLDGYTLPIDSNRIWLLQWTGLLNGDTGNYAVIPHMEDWSVHVFGTFGAGGSISIQGSNETGAPANPIILVDPAGALLTFTAAALKQALPQAYAVRPTVTAGDGTTALTVIVRICSPGRF